ncbi:hypothetical protein P872_05975 [Rhodonellum psychrophilum GCM71 = DSM 17998]|uniref:FecR protein domain-containing protein n=2 Tax=Rhodonellum TaxID=336827 RepID=U5BZM7_9BACT|nr:MULTISPECIES: FecR domain-containing protein [Rhodonellum]ERM83019.1 hypothetical protein P872_05975 [Rhodonellum psychrophilum GCM71 = DSM 17998]SDZ47747.1 FecR family protein [Rhodonellum ikkaensis]
MDKKNPFYRYSKNLLSDSERKRLDLFFEKESFRTKEWDEKSMGKKDEVSTRIWSSLKVSQKEKPKNKSFKRIPLEFAAVFMLMIVAGLYSWINVGNQLETGSGNGKEYHTVAGQRSTIILPDGSTVILNSMSKLSYSKNFNGNNRQVVLEGEAYFEITHDSGRPFIVVSDQLTTQVLGTEFLVKSFANEARSVSVKSGKVLVQNRNDNNNEGVSEQILYAEETVSLDFEKGILRKKPADLKKALAWISGEIFMDNMSLGELALLLERTYAVKIIFKDPLLKSCSISGKLGKMNISEVMDVISSTMALKYNIVHRNIFIEGNSCKTKMPM